VTAPTPRPVSPTVTAAVLVCFMVSAAAAIAVTAVYWTGGDPQWEGLLLGVALGGIGVGLVLWAHHLFPSGPYVQPRPSLASPPAELEATDADFERPGIARRRILLAGLGTAVAALAAAAVFPVRSLGPSPGNALRVTPWRRGRALVTSEGVRIRADDVPVGGLVTVFPEHHRDAADGQTVLIRVEPRLLARSPSRRAGTATGLVAFSKVCTHAGCPVGLYQAQRHQLLCPCHQSAFDVLDKARPVFGPAARALPQLPITIDEDGVVRALGDFPDPVGPGYWAT
jgi:ubiquinol-cytochrome c reductase iron-sulfur subunit